jgi:hypothetical protein
MSEWYKQLDDPASRTGARYYMLITDDAARHRWTLFLKDRKLVHQHLEQRLDHMKNQGFQSPAFLYVDNEFVTGRNDKMG